MKTIFNVYVEMDSQATCDRMKQLCVDNGLKIWKDDFYFNHFYHQFYFHPYGKNFILLHSAETFYHTRVIETEFIELLKQYKDGL